MTIRSLWPHDGTRGIHHLNHPQGTSSEPNFVAVHTVVIELIHTKPQMALKETLYHSSESESEFLSCPSNGEVSMSDTLSGDHECLKIISSKNYCNTSATEYHFHTHSHALVCKNGLCTHQSRDMLSCHLDYMARQLCLV